MDSEDDQRKWLQRLAVAFVLGGTGGNILAISSVDDQDRFKGEDFRREIAERDQTIQGLRDRLAELERTLNGHLEHSATYTEKINQIEERLKWKRVDK